MKMQEKGWEKGKKFGFMRNLWNNGPWEGSTDLDLGIRFAQYVQFGDLHASLVCAGSLLRGYDVYPIYTAGIVENQRFKKLTPFYYREAPMIPIFTKEEYYRQTDGDSLVPLRDISQIIGPLSQYSRRTHSYMFEGVVINPHTDGFFLEREYALDLLRECIFPPPYVRPQKVDR